VRAEPWQAEEGKAKDYGPAVRLIWKILAGPHAGAETSRICSQRLKKRSALGGYVKALRGGKEVEVGEKIDLTDFYGVKGLLVVEETDSGSTRVGTFLKSD
jgi:hypothetical protein